MRRSSGNGGRVWTRPPPSDGGVQRLTKPRARRAKGGGIAESGGDTSIFAGFDYLWEGADVVAGSAWVDSVASASLAWQSPAGLTVTPGQSTAGLNAEAIGAGRVDQAVRLEGGTVFAWQGTVAGLAQSAAQPVLIRALMRHVNPLEDSLPHHQWCELRDFDATGFEIIRTTQFNSAGGLGGGSNVYFGSSGAPSGGAPVNSLPDTRGTWTLHDSHVSGAGVVTYAAAGRHVTDVTGVPTPELTNVQISLVQAPQTDLVAIAVCIGPNAAAWSTTTHDADVVRLLGSIPS